ncbi:MAG: TonB-dependent receptor, partial [bacterium]|nr:TonB-dependent receptor [bacterium]
GNEVELVPPVNFKSGLTYKRGNFGASLQFSHVHEHYSDASNAERTPNAVEGIIPSYHVVDLSLKYKYRNYQLQLGSNNLTDERYFTRRAAGYPGPGIIPSDGRSFYFTVGLDF